MLLPRRMKDSNRRANVGQEIVIRSKMIAVETYVSLSLIYTMFGISFCNVSLIVIIYINMILGERLYCSSDISSDYHALLVSGSCTTLLFLANENGATVTDGFFKYEL